MYFGAKTSGEQQIDCVVAFTGHIVHSTRAQHLHVCDPHDVVRVERDELPICPAKSDVYTQFEWNGKARYV